MYAKAFPDFIHRFWGIIHRYSIPMTMVLPRSAFRDKLLKSATNEPAAQAEFARMEMIEEKHEY